MNIAVVTLYTPEIADIGVETAANKIAYALRHGYNSVTMNRILDPARHPAWSKVLLLLDLIEQGDNDWLFWTASSRTRRSP